jgi:hypothetical protein
MIARLRTELILDVSVGKELELLVGGRGMIDGSRRLVNSRLEWWNWIDEQCAELELGDTVGAGHSQGRWLAVYATGDIIVETLSSSIIAEQSGEEPSPPTRRLPSGPKGLEVMKRLGPVGKMAVLRCQPNRASPVGRHRQDEQGDRQ